jgi:hypothetical protein
LKSAKNVSDEQFSFEKPSAQHPSLLKAGRANPDGFKKLSANSRTFSAKRLRIY